LKATQAGRAGAAGNAGESRCARCGATFHCGVDDPGGCWCAKLPPLPREAYAGGGCLCESCLRRALDGAAADEHRRGG
jgi:hypothetical protein